MSPTHFSPGFLSFPSPSSFPVSSLCRLLFCPRFRSLPSPRSGPAAVPGPNPRLALCHPKFPFLPYSPASFPHSSWCRLVSNPRFRSLPSPRSGPSPRPQTKTWFLIECHPPSLVQASVPSLVQLPFRFRPRAVSSLVHASAPSLVHVPVPQQSPAPTQDLGFN